ncbi:MAG TPA: ABC transporter permease, partial [Blastocatellia bacterium]
MGAIYQDLRYGGRMLLAKPMVSVMAILSLGLGIGASTAIFSVVNSLLLRSLPYPGADKLALVWGVETGAKENDRSQVSATDVADYRSQNTVFDDITTYAGWSATFTGNGEPERVNGMIVGDGYFSIMKGTPLFGRLFSPDDQIDGKDAVVILGYGLWQRRFGGDTGVLGRQVNLNGLPHTIVGVMPRTFAPLPVNLVDYRAEFYRPVGENYDNAERSSRHLRAIARLKQGTTVTQAQAQMRTIASRLEADHPDQDSNYSLRVVTLADDTLGGIRTALLLLMGAVAFVLLIACANVANMLLARATGRAKEIAIRSALGAARFRLIRQFLTESLVLSGAAGALGLALAFWSVKLISGLGSRSLPLLANVSVDQRVLFFTLAISLLTGVVFGLAPALECTRPDLNNALKAGGRTSGSGSASRLVRSSLVVSEVTLAVILLAGAGLLIKTIVRLQAVDPGFNYQDLLTMNISLPSARYPKDASKAEFYKHLLERIAELPGVQSAGYVS